MLKHLAIIMDGNRRWAKSKGLPIKMGHKAGAKAFENAISNCADLGIKILTVYAFSTENWKRSEEEVNTLMDLLKDYLGRMREILKDKDVKVNILGDISAFSSDLIESIQKLQDMTKDRNGFIVNICLNYGGRDEIVHAVKKIVDSGITSDKITEELISNNLYTAGIPDPDLMIRTSGEVRLSNYLLWQLAYTEFLFIDKNWPDFNKSDIEYAIEVYNKRNRKYGGC